MTALTFGELGTMFDGPHATPTRRDEGPYFLNISSLASGRLDLSVSDHVSDEDFAKWTRRVTPQHGDLLFSYETRLGEAALMPAGLEACLGRRMALLRPNRDVVDPRFLLYFYLSPGFQEAIQQRSIHGATVERILLSNMGEWPVEVPSLPTQRAIAEVLGALDDKVAANQVVAASTSELMIALADRLAQDVGTTSLSDLALSVKKQLHPEGMGDVAHYSLPAFDAGELPVPDTGKHILSAKLEVKRPSVLLSRLNPRIPRIWDVPQLPAPTPVASTEFIVLEPQGIPTGALWAVLALRSTMSRLQELARGTSGSHQRVRPEDAMSVELPDARRFAVAQSELLADLSARRHLARVESRHLAALRDTLLPHLMSGRITVRDAEKAVENA